MGELTTEIVSWKSQGVDDQWDSWGYGYTALNKKGIPNSPEIFDVKSDAEKWLVNYIENHPNG